MLRVFITRQVRPQPQGFSVVVIYAVLISAAERRMEAGQTGCARH